MKMIKRGFILSLGWMGISQMLWGSGAGTTAGDFLTLGSGSRLAALGGAGIAVVDDSTSLYWNPGAMTSVPKQSAELMHASYLESTSYNEGSYVRNFGRMGAFGVNLNYFSSGDIAQKDIGGNDNGTFSPNDMSLSAGYAKVLGPVSVGGSAKYIKTTILNSASTLAVDLGVQSKPLMRDRLRLAATATNLLGSLKYDTEKEDLPQEFRVGAGYCATSRVNLVLDGAFPKSGDAYFGGGVEYKQTWGENWALAGRAGYSTRTAGDVSGMTGVTFGLGISRGSLGFDYALVPQGDLGMSHWMTLVYRE